MLRFRMVDHDISYRPTQEKIRVTRHDDRFFYAPTHDGSMKGFTEHDLREGHPKDISTMARLKTNSESVADFAESCKSGALTSSLGLIGGSATSFMAGAGFLGPLAWVGACVMGLYVGGYQYYCLQLAHRQDQLLDRLIKFSQEYTGTGVKLNRLAREHFEELKQRCKNAGGVSMVVCGRLIGDLQKEGALPAPPPYNWFARH